jgi:hypothetical protein
MRALVVLMVGLGCARASGPPAERTLIGLEAPLIPGPGLRVAMPGQVAEVPAEVVIDVASPMSLISKSCLSDPMVSATRVKLPDPLGGEEVFRITRVVGLSVAGRRLVPFEAGLSETQGCTVVLGTDNLQGTALEIDPARRSVRFVQSKPKAAWLEVAGQQGGEVHLLEVTRDAQHDWPLLPARLSQGPHTLTGTFLLSTRDRTSRVFGDLATAAEFRTTSELLDQLKLPANVPLPVELSAFQGLIVDQLELSPGVGVQGISFSIAPGDPPLGVAGVLAADAWGRFHVAIDVGAGVLMVHRPRLFAAGERYQCSIGAAGLSEDACFELHQVRGATSVAVTATVWRPLATGGRVYLDFPGVTPSCRVGFTFDTGDRGRNTQHLVPWPRLFETMKPCAQTLASAKDVTLGLFEDSPLRECPGVCAFAQDLRNGRVSCECQPGPLGLSPDLERQVLERLRKSLTPEPGAQPEPKDPN